MSHILDLQCRTNVLRKEWNSKSVFIYDDHRWILNVLFAIYKDGKPKPNLVFFDAHDDAANPPKPKKGLLKLIGVEDLSQATPKQFGAFVDYDLRPDDSDWLSVAAELNLINDAVVIGNRNNDNLKRLDHLYISEDGSEHHLWELTSNLAYELGSRGTLGDVCRQEEFKDIRDFFNFESNKEGNELLVDFDLDCFTLKVDESPNIPWLYHTYHDKILDNPNAKRFMESLLQTADYITIAREPDYCGNIGNSNVILGRLDQLFFDSALGALPLK